MFHEAFLIEVKPFDQLTLIRLHRAQGSFELFLQQRVQLASIGAIRQIRHTDHGESGTARPEGLGELLPGNARQPIP